MSAASEPHVLDIAWDEGVDLPSLVGPFDTAEEAVQWAKLNTPNGVAIVRPLSYPYLRTEEGNDVRLIDPDA